MSNDLLRLYIQEAIVQESKKIPRKNAFSLKDLLPKTPLEAGLTTAIFGMLLGAGIHLKNNDELPDTRPAATAKIIKTLRDDSAAKKAIRTSGADVENVKQAVAFFNKQTGQGVTIEQLYDSYEEGDIDLDEADDAQNQSASLDDFIDTDKSQFEELQSTEDISNKINELGEIMASDQFVSLMVDGTGTDENSRSDIFLSRLSDFSDHVKNLQGGYKNMEYKDLNDRLNSMFAGANAVQSGLKMLNSTGLKDENPDAYERMMNQIVNRIEDKYPGLGLGDIVRSASAL